MRSKITLLIFFITSSLFANSEVEKVHQYMKLYNQDKKIRESEKENMDIKKSLMLLNNINISNKPKYITLFDSTVQYIKLHHIYTTKIYLPEGAEVKKVIPSADMKKVDHEANRIILQPKSDFVACDIDVPFLYNGKKYDLTIFANRYDNSNENNMENLFYPKIILSIKKELSPEEVLKHYKSVEKTFPFDINTFYHIAGIVYKIQRVSISDNKYNQEIIDVDGKIYRYNITTGE